MKKIEIGLLGAVANSDNMGCLALTYSLVNLIENISKKKDWEVNYHFFEGINGQKGIEKLAEQLKINTNRVSVHPIVYLYKYKTMIHYPKKAYQVYRDLKQCDLFVDLTAGDSFTDIYGNERFISTTRIKRMVEKLNIPLILGPQTYGPFNGDKTIKYAKEAIEHAFCVISRDQASADYLREITPRNVVVTTDLAFGLPYIKGNNDSTTVNIGLNVSSLLVSNKTENTETAFSLSVDYDEYIKRLLEYFNNLTGYEVYLIPHVGKDAGADFHKYCPGAHIVDEFVSPIDAKSFISSMDVFIGARMHATVAAFSSGVATIPTAYSRKFSGLYANLGYNYIVDMTKMSTEEAIAKTIEYVSKASELKTEASKCLHRIEECKIKNAEVFENSILKILSGHEVYDE